MTHQNVVTCDNCKSPKEKIDGKEFIKLLLNAIIVCRENIKPKEMAYIMIGQSNSLIKKQHMSQISEVFGIGKSKPLGFWHSIIRQVYVKQLLTKEIESYGTLKMTDLGKDFLKKPYEIQITEDQHYDNIESSSSINQRGTAMDKTLYNMLIDLRKRIAKKEKSLLQSYLWNLPSLIWLINTQQILMKCPKFRALDRKSKKIWRRIY